jgi:deuterolysin
MLRAAVVLSLFSLALGFAAEELQVKLTASSASVASVDDLLLTAVVSNPTNEDVTVLRFGTILDELPTNTFRVSKDDNKVLFTGVQISPNVASDKAFITIPARGSHATNHTVGALYDFESSGTGTYTFTSPNIFQTKSGDIATLEASTVEVEITSDVAKREIFTAEEGLLRRLSHPVCNDDGNKKNFIAAALSEARALAGGAAADIKSHPSSGQFNTFFGNNPTNDVWYIFDRIAGDLASSGERNLYCHDKAGGLCSSPGVAAYTVVVTSGGQVVGSDIYFCDGYINTSPTHNICSGATWELTRGYIMLHELSHAVGRTDDVRYGCNTSKSLSVSDKKRNADNYACMGLQIHRDYNC